MLGRGSPVHRGFTLAGPNGLLAADLSNARTEKLPHAGPSPSVPHRLGQVLVVHTIHVQHQILVQTEVYGDSWRPKDQRSGKFDGCNTLRFNLVYTLRI